MLSKNLCAETDSGDKTLTKLERLLLQSDVFDALRRINLGKLNLSSVQTTRERQNPGNLRRGGNSLEDDAN